MRSNAVVALAALALTGLAATPAALAQEPTTATKFKVKRNAYGQPDITGTWTNATTTPMERPAEFKDKLILSEAEAAALEKRATDYRAAGATDTDPNAPPPSDGNTSLGYNRFWTDPGTRVMRVAGKPRSSFLTTPDGRVPPRRKGAPPPPARRAETSEFSGGAGANEGPESRGLPERCIHMPTIAGPVMRPVLYNNNVQITQGRDSVGIWIEMIHDIRTIPITDKHRPYPINEWLGDSIGRYEGDSLVVETINYHPLQTFYGASKQLKVTERFTPAPGNRLHYQFTVEDPVVWEKPWGGEYEFSASDGIYEYACHEGNHGLTNILAGAREEERVAAAKAAPTGGGR